MCTEEGLSPDESTCMKQFNLDSENLDEVSGENSPVLYSFGQLNNFLKELGKSPHPVKCLKILDFKILSILTLSLCLA